MMSMISSQTTNKKQGICVYTEDKAWPEDTAEGRGVWRASLACLRSWTQSGLSLDSVPIVGRDEQSQHM